MAKKHFYGVNFETYVPQVERETAFSRAAFNIGLLDQVKNYGNTTLSKCTPDEINLIGSALETTTFADEYPKAELVHCRELNGCEYRVPDNQELWGRAMDDYIIPAARIVARFTTEAANDDSLRLSFAQREAWNNVIGVLANWQKTPHMPNLYADLAKG